MFLRIILMGVVGCLGLDATSAWRLGFDAPGGAPAACLVATREKCRVDTAAVAIATDSPTTLIGAVSPDIAPESVWLEGFQARLAAIQTPATPNGLDSAFSLQPSAFEAAMPNGLDAFARLEEVTADEPPAVVAVEANPDAAFEAIVADQVAAFQIDRAETMADVVVKNPASGSDANALESFEDEANPMWALALSPEVDADGADLPALVPPADEPASTRLAAAVQLTGKALNAWLSVLHAPSVALASDRVARNR